MASTTGKLSLLPAFLALCVIALFAYLIFTDLDSSRTEHTINPPIEIVGSDDLLPLTIIDGSDKSLTGQQRIKQEAEQFVNKLSPLSTEGLAIEIREEHDQFMRHDNIISLPDIEQRSTTIAELLADTNLAEDSQLTISHLSEHQTQTTLAELQTNTEDFNASIKLITLDGRSFNQALTELLNQDIDPNETVTVITYQQHSQSLAFAELSSVELDANQAIIVDIQHGTQSLAIKDIIPVSELSQDSLFYLHRVTEKDQQGLWGIVQTGLIKKFRQGLPIQGIGQNKELASAVIPANADEKLSSGYSSFLGKLLNNKVNSSYIYNFRSHVMGRDANIIQPGQQLILITFHPSELEKIYQFFSQKRNQDIETFGINN